MRSTIAIVSSAPLRLLPTKIASTRSLRSSAIRYRTRNLLAKYAVPAKLLEPPAILPQAAAELRANDRQDAFETVSTAPASPSLQDTPPPGLSAKTKLAAQLPAMVPLETVPPRPITPAKAPELVIEGIRIPAKPVPPGEEECCMSGCVHCVYTVYADDLELYTAALADAKAALEKAGRPLSAWPDVLRGMESKGQTTGDVQEAEKEKVQEGVDPTMAAFLALENKLKKKSST